MRKKAAVVGVALLALLAGLWLLTRPRPHGINQAGFDRITQGMTQREVEEVLGGPPGDYTDRRGPVFVHYGIDWGGSRREEWRSDDGLVVAYFDGDDRVEDKKFCHTDNWPERSWTDRVLRVLPSPFRQ